MVDSREWIADADLDAEQRAGLAEFCTPRTAEDGSLVWPVGEVDSGAH